MPFTLYNEEIVLSGIAARLPESANVEEFGKNLLNGIDMVTENRPRWTPGFLGLPTRNGRVLELDKFDGRFFGVHTKQSHAMDPQLRMLFELTFEAIMDAGVNPHEIRGSNTGVYIGVSGSETELSFSFHPDLINGYVSPGCHRSMFANRISYAFDFHGPSFPIDTACSSSMVALEDAVSAIRLGKCDAAIVGGSNLVLHPYTSLHGLKLGMFSPDGKCKSFDISGDGYVKSEGVAVIFIQKKEVARRSYATILNVRNNTDGFKDKGVTFPSGKLQNVLLNETYAQAGIDPTSLTYFEAHGTGTKAGDPQELNSVMEFSKNRTTPLLIGSVKSNVGHLEPVAGLASIAKMVVAMQAGMIPGNLHYNIPNPEIPGLLDGRLKVVSENTPWEGGIFGINSFGWGGANVHAIFQSSPKNEFVTKLDLEKDLPYLVPFSGRTNAAVEYALEKLSGMEDQREIVALLHQIAKQNIVGHEFRGFKILDGSHIPKIQDSNITKKPSVWFVFSGMGSQADVKSLLRVPPFRNSLEVSAKILMEMHNYDLMSTLTCGDPKIFDKVTNSFVCIVSVQIALVDLLQELGVTPDGMMGHSVGEVSCAYADGCLTQEQTILLAYWRGQAMLETNCPPGAMAAIGLSWEEAKRQCPEGVYPACQNTHDGVTISGIPEAVSEFVQKLKADGVFAREVATSGFAFHSKYINPAADFLREKLDTILPVKAKKRSEKWISTSSHDELCSVDYQINNLVSPVLFANAMDQIPDQAVVIELAPHALLQALLRRALPSKVVRVGLTKKDASDGLLHLLESLGSLYLAGVNLSFDALYEPVQLPVSLSTPMIHPLIQWDHSASWDVATFIKPYKSVSETIIDVSITTEEYSFLEDHMIDGRNICPVMMYMYATWRAFAILTEIPLNQLPVEFEAVEFHRPILLSKDNSLRFYVHIFPSTGRFEIEESDSLLASGVIRKLSSEKCEDLKQIPFEKSIGEPGMTRESIYKEMKLRGYEYKPRFMGVKTQDFNGKWAKIEWQNNWVAFLDSMLHTMILTHRNRDLDLPAAILKLAIDPIAFQEFYDNNKYAQSEGMPAVVEKHLGSLRIPGVELRGMRTSRGTKRPLHQRLPMLNKMNFEPYLDETTVHKDIDGLSLVLDIVLDNSKKLTVELAEVVDRQEDSIINFLKEIDLFRVEYKLARACFISQCTEEWNEIRTKEGGVIHKVETHEEAFDKMETQDKDVIVLHVEGDFLRAASQAPFEGFVILIIETLMDQQIITKFPEFRLISVKRIPGKFIHLFRKMEIQEELPPYHTITLSNTNYAWVEEVRGALKRASVEIDYPKILLVSEKEEHSGVVALVKCLRKEPGGHSLRYIFVKGSEAIILTNPSPALEKILKDDLVHNILNETGVHGFNAHHEYFPDKEVVAGGSSFYLDAGAEGETTFRWHQAPSQCWNGDCSKVHRKINTSYAVLNLAELLFSTGKIGKNLIHDPENSKDVFAVEFSGVDSNGKRVIGISERSGVSTSMCTEKHNFVVELPSNVSLADGATMPMAYSTAIYALLIRGQLRNDETILVHAGAGPIGQAAITLALNMNCTVFTTVGSDAQKSFLKHKFRELNDSHILLINSFEKEILFITKGKGCSTILNTLTDDGLIQSIRVISQNGKFLDISRIESPLSLSSFSKNFTFHRIKYEGLSDRENPERVLVAEKFEQLLHKGVFRPISSKVFNHDELEPAFKFLSTEGNYLKVLLNLTNAELKIKGLKHTFFNSEHVYILAGGLGDTGLEMANWMFSHGARKLLLANRSGVSNTYQAYHIRNWRDSGATIETPKVDIADLLQVREMFELARKMGPIGGIFNLSMVLRDNFLETMTLEDFILVAKPKILGTRNLDILSREAGVCADLKYFVVFSSITSARGNAGQCNYGFGNSAAEAMIESRLRDGLPACALQFGPIADVGYVEYGMGSSGGSAERVIVGTHPQKIKSVLAALDLLLQNPTGIKTSVVIANRNTTAGVGKISLLEALGNVMGVPDSSKLDLGSTLGELGMDSLMAVEMKQMMERDYGLFLSIQEMRTHSLGNLVKLTGRK